MKNLTLILIGFVFIIGCKETPEPPTEPEVTTMSLTVNHYFGDNELDLLNSSYTIASGEEATFKRLAYLIADFYLLKEDGSRLELEDQYALISLPNKTTIELTNIPKGAYKALGFKIGLDSARNHGNPNQWPADHPLSPINNSLHWSWQGGYIFTAIEGNITGTRDNFVYHLAGAQNITPYELEFNFTKDNAALSGVLNYQLDEVFKNPEAFSFQSDGLSTHNVEHPTTKKLTANMVDVLSVKSME